MATLLAPLLTRGSCQFLSGNRTVTVAIRLGMHTRGDSQQLGACDGAIAIFIEFFCMQANEPTHRQARRSSRLLSGIEHAVLVGVKGFKGGLCLRQHLFAPQLAITIRINLARVRKDPRQLRSAFGGAARTTLSASALSASALSAATTLALACAPAALSLPAALAAALAAFTGASALVAAPAAGALRSVDFRALLAVGRHEVELPASVLELLVVDAVLGLVERVAQRPGVVARRLVFDDARAA